MGGRTWDRARAIVAHEGEVVDHSLTGWRVWRCARATVGTFG